MGAIYDDETFFNNYYALRLDKDNYNDNIEQPFMHMLIGGCTGARVLDLGCGYGNLCTWLMEHGARSVAGIDNSMKMIEFAQQNNAAAGITYKVLDAARVSDLEGPFDLVVSSLVLHYIGDLDRLFSDIHTLLAPDGRFIFSMEHPVYTACVEADGLWETDESGRKTAFRLDHFGLEGERRIQWLGKTFTKYHRKTATVINSLLRAGFALTQVIEPSPTEDMMARCERTVQELHRPAYLIVASQKNE